MGMGLLHECRDPTEMVYHYAVPFLISTTAAPSAAPRRSSLCLLILRKLVLVVVRRVRLLVDVIPGVEG